MFRTRCVKLCLLTLLCAPLPDSAVAALVQSYQATGNLGLEVDAVDANAQAGQINFLSGTFSLTQMPLGALIQRATVYTNDWLGGTLSLTFGGIAIPGTGVAFQTDQVAFFTLSAYQWDVTNFLIAAPPFQYNFSIQSNNLNSQIAGAALVVVWSDPFAPLSTVTIIDGAKQVGETIHGTPPLPDTETATFTGIPAGQTLLSLFTVSDDTVGSNEVVTYNGGPDRGNLDANLGFGSSLLQFAETSVAGNNIVSITSGADHFGWLVATSITTPVPEPSSMALVGVLSLCLGGAALNRRRRSPRQ